MVTQISAQSLTVPSLVLLLLALGCADKAEAALRECERLSAQGKADEARQACLRAVSADSKGKSGKAAASLLNGLKDPEPDAPCSCPPGDPLCDCLVKAQRRVAAEKEAALQKSAAAPPVCKSGKWTTFCEINGRPSGGLLKPKAFEKCEEDAKGFVAIGMQCAPCKCADDVEGAIVE